MTIETVTDEQIQALRDDAANHGDHAQVAICLVALGEDHHDVMLAESERSAVSRYQSADSARRECARVIRDAEAQ